MLPEVIKDHCGSGMNSKVCNYTVILPHVSYTCWLQGQATEGSVKHEFHWLNVIQLETDDFLYHSRFLCALCSYRAWWVGVCIIQYVFVSLQWKHTLRDGKSLARHFSCCGQRFPWQVSLNSAFVVPDSFLFLCLKTRWHLFYASCKVRTEA